MRVLLDVVPTRRSIEYPLRQNREMMSVKGDKIEERTEGTNRRKNEGHYFIYRVTLFVYLKRSILQKAVHISRSECRTSTTAQPPAKNTR